MTATPAQPEQRLPAPQAPRVEALALTGATDDEIALQMEISVKKLRHKFGPVLHRARSTLKVRLRARQVNLALGEKGSERMLLWLGRQYLGQKESPTADNAEQSAAGGKVYVGIRLEDI